MKEISSAEEFVDNQFTIPNDIKNDVYDFMIAFAKLHVDAALEAAAKNALLKYDEEGIGISGIDKDSILNSYPEINIK